jgi:glycerophosphoryl diester phosphodiesterase
MFPANSWAVKLALARRRPFDSTPAMSFHFVSRAALALVLSCALLPGTLRAVDIIAHRGASFDAPENTLASMKLGWTQNADGVELDLWLSKDGRLLVFHDKDTKRFETNSRAITNLTLAEARQLDVGSWKSVAFKGEPVPTLESILATIPPGKRVVLEIKDGPRIVPELTRVLRASGLPEKQMVVISFNFDSLAASKKDWPGVEHYFLADYKKDAKTQAGPELKPLLARAKKAGFEGLNLNFKWPVTKEFVSEVKAGGLKLYIWTVNDAVVARALVDAGVDGITTDRPAWLREQLK